MGASRTPVELLELKGSYKKDPQRRRPASPKSKHPVGDAPGYLDEAETEIWYEIISISAPGVLVSSDRLILARLCQLESKVRTRTATGSETGQHLKCLGVLGLTPADRSRIGQGSKEESNPYASF
jgi:phage terminase small subunit